MTSEPLAAQRGLYAWVWLPDESEPVVAGVVTPTARTFAREPVLTFTYARSYRERPRAISLFPPELPLGSGTYDPTTPSSTSAKPRSPLALHGCLRDAAPGAWGRRVLNLRLAGDLASDLSELTYLAQAGSDRIGALDFQSSPATYVPRGEGADLDQLLAAAELIEAGQTLPPDLEAAAGHGTSIGGARPKALLEDGDRHLIAKFASSTDTRPAMQAEAVAMLLAARVGLDVAPVELRNVGGRKVLLVERFDRGPALSRRLMLSALTVLGYAEMESRHSSYAELADDVRSGPWTSPAATLRELFTRLVLNVCTGNKDDHLRNHAAFWDGRRLTLTPAYDIAPSSRSTPVSSQAIGITRDGRRSSQLWLCREVAGHFLLTPAEAEATIDHVVSTITSAWSEVCDLALLTSAERQSLWQREFLNAYVFQQQP